MLGVRYRTHVGAVLARDSGTSVCLMDCGASIAGEHRSHKRARLPMEIAGNQAISFQRRKSLY